MSLVRYRAFGPDSDPAHPIILCPRHAQILMVNMKKLADDRSLDPTLDPEFDPMQVQIEPAGQGLPCRVEWESEAERCGEAPGLAVDG
jgi:hypothetical protein